MSADKALTPCIVLTGDHEIAQFLELHAEVNYPAFACAYDGFVNDTFTEYANPSIYRPASIRSAQLPSELSVRFFHGAPLQSSAQPKADDQAYRFLDPRPLQQPGTYYLGWTMYDQAGVDENVTVWLGDDKIARVQGSDNDNRVHLYVLQEPFFIDYGERLRIRTDANGGQYRFENIVLLRSLPTTVQNELQFSAISAELIRTTTDGAAVRLNWRTSRPAQCEVLYGSGDRTDKVVEAGMLANHCVDFPGVDIRQQIWFQISGQTPAGQRAQSDRLALADFLPQSNGVTQSGTIPFTVTNQVDARAVSWPVTWGFPFPRSALWDLDQCRLVRPDGVPIPAQKRVQVAWDDGNIRWALFDFNLIYRRRGRQNSR